MTASIVNENSLKFISMLSLMFVSLNVKSRLPYINEQTILKLIALHINGADVLCYLNHRKICLAFGRRGGGGT